MAKLFELRYKKYNDVKIVKVVASTIEKALERGQFIAKKNYASKVDFVSEILDNVEVVK